jgi:amino-acid N-acetyltransferase
LELKGIVRNARLDDVPVIRDLINSYAELGIMLFRSMANLYDSLRDFKLYEEDGQILGCCALQIVWADLAEVKSLAVRQEQRGRGIGSALVEAVLAEARELHLARVFALTLEKGFFERFGFQKVPMDSLPNKVWSDCVRCPKQDKCDEIAVLCSLRDTPRPSPLRS